MAVLGMDHVSVNVTDLDSAVDFFTDLGLEVEGRTEVQGDAVDGVTGHPGAHTELVFMQTPDKRHRIEVVEWRNPGGVDGSSGAPIEALGIRHLMFSVDDLRGTFARLEKHGAELVGEIVNYEDAYLLCYLRGPDGIIVELAEELGGFSDAP